MALTVSVAEVAGDGPTLFEHVSVYVSVPTAVGLRVCVPLVGNAPDQLPEAVQPVELAEDHVIVVELPVTIEDEPKVSVGAAGAAVAPVTDSVTEAAGEVPAKFVQTRV